MTALTSKHAEAPASRPSSFSQYRILVSKDLRYEFRTHEMLTSMGLYAVLVLVIFGTVFSFLGSGFDVTAIAGGLAWMLIVFTSLLGLGRSFSYEKEASAIEGLLLVPMDRSVIYLAKVTTNVLFLFAVEAVTLPLFYFFFLTGNEASPLFWLSLLPIILGTFGISAVGTLLSSITASSRSRDVLLAVLFVPVIFPLLYACVGATTACIAGTPDWVDALRFGCILSGAYDIVMLLASWLLYGFVIEG